jgi:hypothetical protein
MLYMVELHYTQVHRDAAMRYFWEHGATHYEGNVTVEGAWVATQELVAYALVDAAEAGEVAKACAPLELFGDVSYRPVMSIDQL